MEIIPVSESSCIAKKVQSIQVEELIYYNANSYNFLKYKHCMRKRYRCSLVVLLISSISNINKESILSSYEARPKKFSLLAKHVDSLSSLRR